MSEIACHANCIFQNDGNCHYKFSTYGGLPSCRDHSCVYYVPRSISVKSAQWHEVPHRCSEPLSPSDRQIYQDGRTAVWE